MASREGPYKTRPRISEVQRKLIRAMSPRVGIKRRDIREVLGPQWRQVVNSLIRKGHVEWGAEWSEVQRDRLFFTEKGRLYRERFIHASAMGDLSLIGNGYREAKEEGLSFTRSGPWKHAALED